MGNEHAIGLQLWTRFMTMSRPSRIICSFAFDYHHRPSTALQNFADTTISMSFSPLPEPTIKVTCLRLVRVKGDMNNLQHTQKETNSIQETDANQTVYTTLL